MHIELIHLVFSISIVDVASDRLNHTVSATWSSGTSSGVSSRHASQLKLTAFQGLSPPYNLKPWNLNVCKIESSLALCLLASDPSPGTQPSSFTELDIRHLLPAPDHWVLQVLRSCRLLMHEYESALKVNSSAITVYVHLTASQRLIPSSPWGAIQRHTHTMQTETHINTGSVARELEEPECPSP